MKYNILITLFCILFCLSNTEAAIFIPDVVSTTNNSIQVSFPSSDGSIQKSKSTKKSKRQRAERVDKVDNLAKWGFISSIAGFVSLFLLPVVTFALFPLAIGLSIAGLNSIKKNNTRGKGYAIAGLSLGSAGVLLLLVGLVLVISFLSAMN